MYFDHIALALIPSLSCWNLSFPNKSSSSPHALCVCPITLNCGCLCKCGWEVMCWIKCHLPDWGVWPTCYYLNYSVKGVPHEHCSVPWQNAGGPSLVQSYTGSHCCSEFKGATAASCLESGISQGSSPPSSSHILSASPSAMFHWLLRTWLLGCCCCDKILDRSNSWRKSWFWITVTVHHS